MSVGEAWVRDPANVEAVLTVYLSEERPTLQQTAKTLGTTFHNVRAVVERNLTDERYRAEKALRYSRSKVGDLNPMTGRSGSQHHNYRGDIFNDQGYVQRKVDGHYVLVHRIVMAELLGLDELPDFIQVHHIDEDKTNNDPSNLAVVTVGAHRALHAKRSKFEKSPLWVQYRSTTLRSRGSTVTRRPAS